MHTFLCRKRKVGTKLDTNNDRGNIKKKLSVTKLLVSLHVDYVGGNSYNNKKNNN